MQLYSKRYNFIFFPLFWALYFYASCFTRGNGEHVWGGNGAVCVSKSLYPQLSTTPCIHVVFLWKLSAWWTTEFLPVYANPTSLNKEEDGRMVKDTDAGDDVSVKTPGGRQRETTSLLFPRIWLVRSQEPASRQNTNDDVKSWGS